LESVVRPQAEGASKPNCQIRYGKGTYILEVDGLRVPFHGSRAADYFEQLYRSLGYDVGVTKGRF
jgi:hypothetical protein